MPSMTAPPVMSGRPPLPVRPRPHERDGRQPQPGDGRPHPHTAGTSAANRRLGDLLTRMVHEADARIPADRRARRTLQDMQERMPGYERQPVLVLYRPVMVDDARSPGTAPAPAPIAPGAGMQCDRCGGTFGAAPAPTGTQGSQVAPTAWTCDACTALGI